MKVNEIRKIFFDDLDRIYESSEKICKDWDKKTIPLITLFEIIKRLKPKAKTGNKQTDELIKQFNITLDSLYIGCKSIADRMDSKSVPLSELLRGINLIKGSFKAGLK